MKTNTKETFILNLLNKLVAPAFGCTEIGCIAYATSIAAENLKSSLAKATVYVSGFIYRNVVDVGVPLIGKIGAKGISAAGFVVKQSHKKLLVLEDISQNQITDTKKLIASSKIKVIIQKKCNPVYVRVVAKDTSKNICDVFIERKHDTVKHIKLNGVNLSTKAYATSKIVNSSNLKFDVDDISLPDICNTIKNTRIEELSFLQKGIDMNKNIADFPSKKNKYFRPIYAKQS
jgi:L-cysteine desulfidase